MSQFRNNVIQTLSREAHGVPVADTNWLEQVEYSDGVGRVALVKTKAESDRDGNERWVGTGRVAYNNKGNPVKQYEPYFTNSNGWESIEIGVTPIMHYDPLSRLIQTDFPDGTHSKVELTAWKQEDYDQNDTTESTNSHYNTPTITHFDSLGRPFYVVTNDGNGNKPVTRTVLDIEGNEKRIVDALGRDVMEYKYGIHGEKAYTKSMDAGERWMLLAADEQPIYTWDSRRHKLHTEYDALRRPTKQWLNDEILVGETVYGEEAGLTTKQNNLCGQPWKIYDQSGLVENVKFDLKGNLLESKRQLTQEYKQTINWSANPTLESETFTTINAYNALNRATSIKAPHNNVNTINEILPEYDDGGLLKGVKAKLRGATEATSFVEAINYNPKAQRARIKYGNGATTKYTYDDKTFRLTRLWTFRNGGNENLQDLNYTYDPVGNITEIIDNAQQDVFFNGQHITPSQKFEYDALYRLIMAEGREHVSVNANTEPEVEGYNPAHISPEDGSAMREYEREWKYDEVGNILEVIHQANANSWTKHHTYASDSNRLDSISIGQTAIDYSDNYNEHGSMKKMPHLQKMDWDFAERLSHVTRGDTESYYNYDGNGERVRKVVEKDGVVETRLYLGGFEIFRKRNSTGLVLERETLHIMDDTTRIALVETLTIGSGTTAPVQRYQLSNNIESATLELDEEANIISYEEYYSYGETSYRAGRNVAEVGLKRYRYTGKEKDEENGLYYHGARYYACWLGRWTATDPAGLVDGINLYVYCRGNPVKLLDPNGNKGIDLDDVVSNYHEFEPLEIKGDTSEVTGVELSDASTSSELSAASTSSDDIDSKVTIALSSDERNKLISEIIEDMIRIEMDPTWLEDTQDALIANEARIGRDLLRIEIVDQLEYENTGKQVIAHLKPTNEGQMYIIFNAETLKEYTDEGFKGVIVHELRHVWQRLQGTIDPEWREKVQRRCIDIEVDAFDIQYEFEGKMGISAEPYSSREMYERFKDNHRLRAKTLWFDYGYRRQPQYTNRYNFTR